MGRPTAAIPDFDDTNPWGRYRPRGATALRLAIMRHLPALCGPLAKALRKPIKYRLNSPLDLIVWGLRLRLLPRGNMSEQKILTAPHLFDPEEFRMMRRLLAPGGVFVDAGANAGFYSFWADHCMRGRGLVLAIEPDPEMRRRLTFNAATNGITGIRVLALALSDHDGVAQLQVNPVQRGTNTLEPAEAMREGGARQTLEVEVTTLLGLLDRLGVDRIDVLKLDIEGHEPTVLRHFLAHAAPHLLPRAVIAEFKPDTAQPILDLMQQCGYRRRETSKLNFIFERDG